MAYFHPAFEERQRQLWMRPDAHRFMRPDARNWMRPDAARWAAPGEVNPKSAQTWDRKYSPDQPRVPAGNPKGGQWTSGSWISNELRAAWDAFSSLPLVADVVDTQRLIWDSYYILPHILPLIINEVARRDPQAMDLQDFDALASVLAVPKELSPGDLGYSPEKPRWHEYVSDTNIVCEASWNCSRKDIVDQFARFAVPGQDPEIPVESGETYRVYTPGVPIPVGYVKTTVGDDGLAIMNKTIDGHIFHDGAIVRRAYQEIDGSWRVVTLGFGNNAEPGGAYINEKTGPGIFNWLDRNMRASIKSKLGIGTKNAFPESWKSSSDSHHHNGARNSSRSGRSRGFKNGASHVA